jgi:hypothetical protein
MKRFLLILLLAVGISGCQQQKDQAYYLKHPAKLKTILHRCDAQASPDDFCQASYKMGLSLNTLIQSFMKNQQVFGQKILQAQMKRADLQRQLNQAKSSDDQVKIASLKEQVSQAQSQVEAYRAVVSMFMRF